MRYYVISDSPDRPYILAEVVREEFDDGQFRESSLASPLSGASSTIVTEHELLEWVGGIDALEEWNSGDDRRFEHHSETMADTDPGDAPARQHRHLRVVRRVLHRSLRRT